MTERDAEDITPFLSDDGSLMSPGRKPDLNAEAEEKPKFVNNRPKAIFWANLNVFVTFLWGILIKSGQERGLNNVDMLLYAHIAKVLYCGVHAYICGIDIMPAKENRGLVLIRGINCCVALFTLTLAYSMITLLSFNVIQQTAPFWAGLFSWLFTGEHITWVEKITMAVSFTVISLMMTYAAKVNPEEELTQDGDRGQLTYTIGCAVCLLGALTNGAGMV
jgi:drug/metabolite transporter (DMT)-like permease